MITPKFKLRQDDAFVYADIQAPHIKASDVEFVVDGTSFTLHCKPYFLKLNFEQQLVQDGRETASYNIDAGLMSCALPKAEPGQHFDNLDMITKLLTVSKRPAASAAGPPGIEVLGGDCDSDSDSEWYKQPFPVAAAGAPACDASAADGEGIRIFEQSSCYGFGSKYKGLFADVEADMDVLAAKGFDACSASERQQQRHMQEEEAFDLDAYMNDTYDPDDDVQSFLAFEAQWASAAAAAAASTFSDEEQDELQRLPRRSYVLSRQDKMEAAAALAGIVYAFCSDRRMGMGDGSCESGSNMARLAPPLCALDTCAGSIHDMVVACVRRSVTFCLYRSFRAATCVVKDVACVLRLGRIHVLKVLLDVRRDLHASDLSLLVRVWIEDLLCWLQSLPDAAAEQLLPAIAAAVEATRVSKRNLGFAALQQPE
jgi:protein SHQ1